MPHEQPNSKELFMSWKNVKFSLNSDEICLIRDRDPFNKLDKTKLVAAEPSFLT